MFIHQCQDFSVWGQYSNSPGQDNAWAEGECIIHPTLYNAVLAKCTNKPHSAQKRIHLPETAVGLCKVCNI